MIKVYFDDANQKGMQYSGSVLKLELEERNITQRNSQKLAYRLQT